MRDISRYGPQYDADRVVVDVGKKLPDIPKWDNFENNHFAMRRRLVGIWLKATNMLLIRNRAGKRLQKLKARLKQEGVKNRADARKLVIDDWKRAQNVQIVESENEDDIKQLKFKFSFNITTISAT